jgi:predicted metalloprotease with PDZ domain
MIHYTIAMPQPHTHRYHVTIEIDNHSGATLDLALPVWTPGSYMVRDYARHVESFVAQSGEQVLAWQKIDKTTWQISTNDSTSISATYEVYANELTVRTSHLDGSHGYFNPATLCMFIPGRTEEAHRVTIVPPAGWHVTTGLRSVDASGMVFLAHDYDELVDSPFECGTHRLLTFEVEQVAHEIAIWGTGNEDEAKLIEDTRRIVVATRVLFDGPLPYERYVFILHLSDGLYGGLEHRNSVTNIIDRWTFQPAKSYERYLGLTSHEFYHVWNVKRIRPAPLGPFDYRRENYTRQLWISEGITSYYDNLILVRAGLITPERYLEILAESIVKLQSQPGRQIQSLAQSSFDTWIKLYRPDENSANSSISYYLKGSLVALLLDMAIRNQMENEAALDDVLRQLFTHVYGGSDQSRFYAAPAFDETAGFLAALEAAVGTGDGSYRALLARYVGTTEELDYAAGLAAVGVRLAWSHKDAKPDGSTPATLGVTVRQEQGRLRVATIVRDGPAEQAGIYAADELVALDGFRASDEKLKARLAERKPGERMTLSIFRGDRLLQIEVTLAEAPYDALRLELDPAAPEPIQRRYRDWVGIREG